MFPMKIIRNIHLLRQRNIERPDLQQRSTLGREARLV